MFMNFICYFEEEAVGNGLVLIKWGSFIKFLVLQYKDKNEHKSSFLSSIERVKLLGLAEVSLGKIPIR